MVHAVTVDVFHLMGVSFLVKEAKHLHERSKTESVERLRQQEQVLEKDHKLQEAELAIKDKFGKNAILKGLNLKSESTGAERNMQIGGHKSGEKGGKGNAQKG